MNNFHFTNNIVMCAVQITGRDCKKFVYTYLNIVVVLFAAVLNTEYLYCKVRGEHPPGVIPTRGNPLPLPNY